MLNERNKANKAKKAKWEDERDESDAQGIEAADADRERPSLRREADRYKDHSHGKYGDNRGGKKKKGSRSPIQGRLARVVKGTEPEEKKTKAKEVMKKNLMSHTVYQDMGYLMAESLGLVSEARREVERARDSGVPTKSTPFKRGGDGEDSVDRARKDYKAKVKRHSVNMVGADVEPSEVTKSRKARKRGGTKGRVEAAKGVKYLQGSGKTTIKPSTKANLLKKPKPPEYK